MKLLEEKIIRIVEERGYAGSKYIPVVRSIVNYISKYIFKNPKNIQNGWTLYIPKNITERIDIINNLTITVNIIDNPNGEYFTGEGTKFFKKNNEIINGKLRDAEIIIDGYSNKNQLFRHTIFNSLSHELNHVIDEYNRMLKYNDSKEIIRVAKNQMEISNTIFSENETVNRYIRNIFYRLLFKNELNALINGVYGDLEARNSTRDNFKKDIKLTQAYNVYSSILDNINILNNLTNEEWINVMGVFKKNNFSGRNKPYRVNLFKRKFIELVKYKLKILLKGIGKISSYYYDRREDKIPIDEVLNPKCNENIKLNLSKNE